jgi:hypothetical protein
MDPAPYLELEGPVLLFPPFNFCGSSGVFFKKQSKETQ